MLPIRKNCCCVEKKPGLRENLREILDADSVGVWVAMGEKGRVVTYPRSNSLVPSRTCDSRSSQFPNEVPWGGQAEAFYRSMAWTASNSLFWKQAAAYGSHLIRYRRTCRVRPHSSDKGKKK